MPPPPKSIPFRFAPSFHEIEETGSFVPGDFEAQYEALFAEALDAGPIRSEERQRLNLAASALGIDEKRLDALEQALLMAYETRASITETDARCPGSLADHALPSIRDDEINDEIDDTEYAAPSLGSQAVLSQPGVVRDPLDPIPISIRFEDTPASAPSSAPVTARMPSAPVHPIQQLHNLFQQGTIDERFRAAALLVQRNAATPQEHDFYLARRPSTPLRPTHPLTATAWDSLLVHPEQDRVTGQILAVIASAVLLGRVTAMRRDKSLPKLDPANKQDPKKSTVSVTRAMAWSAATLGLSTPPIYLHPQEDIGIEFVTAVPPAVKIGTRMLSGQSAIQLAFHCARQLSWFRGEHFVATLVPSLAHLDDLFLAALHIGAPNLELHPEVRGRIKVIAAAIVPVLEPAQVATLRFHVSEIIDRGARPSLRSWARCAELTSCRAGLLLAGDLAVATEIVRREQGSDERVSELEAFWMSDAYARLRRQLSVEIT